MEFIDIAGASGTTYRFKRWPASGAIAPIAGNYAVFDPQSRTIVRLGVVDNLSQIPIEREADDVAIVFTRFNVSRAQREAEHADILALHPHLSENLA